MLNSEWGATNDPAVVARQTDEFDHYMLGDVFWDYRNLVRNVTAAPTGANVNEPLVEILDRPYPQAVAGTPKHWSWDSTTRTFRLEYSTTLPDGRDGAKMVSDIYVPELHFPSGYVATAKGAKVVSAPGSTTLILRNSRGATDVSVTITPPTG